MCEIAHHWQPLCSWCIRSYSSILLGAKQVDACRCSTTWYFEARSEELSCNRNVNEQIKVFKETRCKTSMTLTQFIIVALTDLRTNATPKWTLDENYLRKIEMRFNTWMFSKSPHVKMQWRLHIKCSSHWFGCPPVIYLTWMQDKQHRHRIWMSVITWRFPKKQHAKMLWNIQNKRLSCWDICPPTLLQTWTQSKKRRHEIKISGNTCNLQRKKTPRYNETDIKRSSRCPIYTPRCHLDKWPSSWALHV